MSDKIVTSFADDLDALVERYREEHHLAYGAIIGTLSYKQHLLCRELSEQEFEEKEAKVSCKTALGPD